MQYITSDPKIHLVERILKEPQLTVTHLVLRAGEVMHEHLAPSDALVIPFKGKLMFFGEAGSNAQEIQPGMIVRLTEGEAHALEALEDSELMVVKMILASA
ncbi:MAG: hypothetical protein IJ125_00650 [Atopobiaceae bacterium]|nr:hypothetical protein [Atopobiaceae bacterium]